LFVVENSKGTDESVLILAFLSQKGTKPGLMAGLKAGERITPASTCVSWRASLPRGTLIEFPADGFCVARRGAIAASL